LITGAAGYCYFWAGQFDRETRENLLFLAECKDSVSTQTVLEFKAILEKDPDIRQVEFISSERAAALLVEDELNPVGQMDLADALPNLLGIRFKSLVYDDNRLDQKLERLRANKIIQGIYAQPELIDQLRQNLKTIGTALGLFAILIIALCSFLLTSIIKLSLYADRTEIKTMQLVGAKASYIRRPYIKRYVGLSLAAGLGASLMLIAGHFSILGFSMPGLELIQFFGLLTLGIIAIGLILSTLVTFRMVNKYIFADIAMLF
jgi:cell division transport system permease protein